MGDAANSPAFDFSKALDESWLRTHVGAAPRQGDSIEERLERIERKLDLLLVPEEIRRAVLDDRTVPMLPSGVVLRKEGQP